ncbi:MAG TPA: 23S rRNA (uracil(1939)-C(5))-methyltransferase RlmD [Gaiellaceae bacterium]|jgi:23S rRNA (uracil1939-C5)-methyltransferase|nr:23S rRNA (uracil(1939)-C(5))-methyltransferase RlmD [Gaiellaceae bacterium]
MPAPVQRGQELELDVDSLAYGGNGVARLDGFVVFVRRGLPGDRVRARVTKVKRGFAEALATEVLTAGPNHVDAPCAHYPACGGCRFQDLDYSVQVEAKAAQVREALRRIGGIEEPPLEPILPAEEVFHYRNKMEYSFTQTPSGPTLGLHRAGRWDEVLEIEQCWLTTDLGNRVRNAVREWAREEGLEAYDQAEQTGYLRHLVLREGRNTGQLLVQLVTATGERFDRDYLLETLRRFPEVRSIHWSENEQPSEVTNLPTELLWGEDAIEEELCGLRFRVRPNSFLQTNTRMAERLYELARDYAALTGGETLWDLYCGIGTLGLVMAPGALTVWGVEIVEEAVACAIENAELNGVANAAFFAGNVGQSIEELHERAGDPHVVVVDPPRAGLAGKALRRLGRIEAPRVVYVSCNPTTLASDVRYLAENHGYRLVKARPVDMFPHTPHVETVALLER